TTYLPNGKEVDVDKKDIYEEEVNKNWSQIRFTFPALKPGAIIEYKYELVSRLTFELPEWYFQDEIPVKHSELWLEIPEWYDYIFLAQGNVPRPKVDYSYSDLLIGSADRINVKVVRNTYVMENAPALRPQPYITTLRDYFARIRFQLKEYRFPGYMTEHVLTTWPKLAEELWEADEFGGRMKREGSFSDVWEAAQPYLDGAQTTTEKIAAVYNFINRTFEVGDKTGIWSMTRFNQCLKEGKANRHVLNMMMVALLRKAGVEAHPVLISTRTNGLPIQTYPLIDQFDHVLCLALDDDGGAYFLEAGDPFRPIGILDENSLNRQGWVAIEGRPQWVDLPKNESSATYFMSMELTNEGGLTGTISCSFEGYEAIRYRKALLRDPDAKPLKDKVKEIFPEGEIDSIVYTDIENINKPLKAKIYCHLPEAGMAAGNFIYLSPAMLSEFNENPFKYEERLFPVDFPYPVSEKIIANIDFPEGYQVNELPESVKMSMEGDGGSFQYRLSQRGNRLQLISEMKVKKLHFLTEKYATLRNFFNLVSEKISSQVVLSKT
ncbi:MAG: DUF3857 domain-containing protein, partial [Bacteroidetes bacterium]